MQRMLDASVYLTHYRKLKLTRLASKSHLTERFCTQTLISLKMTFKIQLLDSEKKH